MSKGKVVGQTHDHMYKMAREMGLVCVVPTSVELQADLDDGAELNNDVLTVLIDQGFLDPNSEILETISKSGNRHNYLTLKRSCSVSYRIGLQAALGSDPVRETLSMARCFVSPPGRETVLFETPEEAIRVEEWRRRVVLGQTAAAAA